MESNGTGNFVFGYLGGLMDTATDLIYVGNGQYYDPTTGRFLNRNTNPNSTNPYVPWGGNPTGALITPLALLSLLYSRRKKRGTLDTIIILVVIGVAFSLGLSGCNFNQNVPGGNLAGSATPTPTPTEPSALTVTATYTPTPSSTPVPSPSATCTATVTPLPPGAYWFEFVDNWTISYYVSVQENDPYFTQDHGFPYPIGLKGPLPGLDQNHIYDLNWAYGWKGVLTQGTGHSSYGEYVTKDWTKSTPDKIYFTIGMGGKWGPPRAWQTVASSDGRFGHPVVNNKYQNPIIQISGIPRLEGKGPFEVTDTGEQVGNSHLDVFIGDELLSTADGYGICTFCAKVSLLVTGP
jgi:hypothetical protein